HTKISQNDENKQLRNLEGTKFSKSGAQIAFQKSLPQRNEVEMPVNSSTLSDLFNLPFSSECHLLHFKKVEDIIIIIIIIIIMKGCLIYNPGMITFTAQLDNNESTLKKKKKDNPVFITVAATGEKIDSDLDYYGFNNSTYFLIFPSVTNSASQGSVLAAVLCNVFISDIAEGLLGQLGLFAEDTKINNDVETIMKTGCKLPHYQRQEVLPDDRKT
ncbi:hypothetical protein L345_10646, partial [Ophiophagus hannah]